MITTIKTTHKTEETVPKCDTCGAFATHAVMNNREIPSSDSEGYREFEVIDKLYRGCAKHPVISCTRYLDGRVLETSKCVPEKIEWALRETI